MTVTGTVTTVFKPSSSVTVNVIVAVPVWLATGVTDRVRLWFVPPSVIAELGIKPVFEEMAATRNWSSGVMSSKILKRREEVTFAATVQIAETEIVGGWFCG